MPVLLTSLLWVAAASPSAATRDAASSLPQYAMAGICNRAPQVAIPTGEPGSAHLVWPDYISLGSASDWPNMPIWLRLARGPYLPVMMEGTELFARGVFVPGCESLAAAGDTVPVELVFVDGARATLSVAFMLAN